MFHKMPSNTIKIMSLNTNDSNITVVFLRLHLGKQEPLKIGKVSSSYLSIDRGKARTDRLPLVSSTKHERGFETNEHRFPHSCRFELDKASRMKTCLGLK